MKRWKIALIILCIGVACAYLATLPLLQHSTYISNHGDINRGLIFAGVARQAVLSGELPLWNPYTCGGSPMLADVESWFLQPFFFLTLPLNELVAMKISYTLTLLSVFLGFTLLGRKVLRFQLLGAVTFGFILSFGGYLSQHLAEGYYVWGSMAWVPWFLLAGMLSIRKPRYIFLAGLMLVFMFGAGSMHMVVYSLLFLGLVTLFQTSPITMRRRGAILIGIILWFAILASIKLLPALSILETNESRLGFTPPVTLLPQMLFARGILPPLHHGDIVYRWGEFGTYIGFVSIVLVCAGLVCKRQRIWIQYREFLIARVLMLVLAFTSFPITHGVLSNIMDLFRMPSRLMIFPLIGLSILAARGMDVISSNKRRLSLAIALLLLLAVDLISNDYQIFSRTFSIPLPELHIETIFMRVKRSYSTPDDTYYRAAYVDYRENRGVNDLCRFYQRTPSTSAINGSLRKKVDRGEVYVSDAAAGSVELLSRNPQQLTIAANIQTATSLMVNMNYYSGWNTKEGFPVHEQDGLIAVALPPGEHKITLVYAPSVVFWGALISSVGMLVGIFWFFRR